MDTEPTTAETPERPEQTCPHCTANLIGELASDYYGKPYYPRLAFGHEEPGIYDGILYWSCPFCRGTWHQFDKSYGRRYQAAQRFIHGPVDRATPSE